LDVRTQPIRISPNGIGDADSIEQAQGIVEVSTGVQLANSGRLEQLPPPKKAA